MLAFLAKTGIPEKEVSLLDDHSMAARFRHACWRPHRKRVFEALVRTGQSGSRIAGFGSCGSGCWVQRSNKTECIDGIWKYRYRLSGSNCHDRLCTPCANSRSFRIQLALLALIGKQGISFITLTLCGKDETLQALVDRIYVQFKALRNHPLWSENVRGGAAFLEIKWSDKAQRWHPHLHIVADARYIDQGELSTAWHSITRDSYIVDIRRVKNMEEVGRYVTKYASKPLNMSFANTPKLLDEAVIALRSRRLCLCFGTWYGTPLSALEDEELADDMLDAGGYSNFMMFDDLLEQASCCDPWALEIIRGMDAESRFRALLTPT